MRDFYRFTAFAVVVASSVVASAQETWRWARNLDEARTVAAQSNRLVLIHFGGKNCRPCRQLERDVFAQPGFGQSLTGDYVGVMIDAELYPATARQFQVESWPTDVIVTPDMQVVERIQSPMTVAGYTATMSQIAGDFHQRQEAAATLYRQPTVSYGAVRPATPPRSAEMQAPAAPPAYVTNQATQANAATQVNPAPQTAAAPAGAPPAKRDRYADYYEQLGQQPAAPPMHDSVAQQQAAPPPVVTPPAQQDRYQDYRATQQAAAPAPNYTVPSRPYAPPQTAWQRGSAPPSTVPPNAMQPSAAPANAELPRSRPVVTQEQLPPGSAPLSLDGYCPVALAEQQRWVPGDVRYGAQHEGRTYLFSTATEQQKFLQQPHRYAPVMAGNDPVLATDNGQLLSGHREHGLFVNGRIYLFASEESLGQFERNRDRYVQSVNRTLR